MVDPYFEIKEEDGDIESFMSEDRWHVQKMKGILPEDIVDHIVENITISKKIYLGIPYWISTTNGKLIVLSAYQLIGK